MSLIFTLGSTVHDWGWPKNGPFWTKNGQTWQACQRSKVVQRGPKGTKMVNIFLFDHLGPRLGPSGPFWAISNKNEFFAPNGCGGGASEQKINFCLKWSKRVQMGPKGSQMVKNTLVDHFGPFWTLLDHFGTMTSLTCLANFGPKYVIFGPSPVMIGGPQSKKRVLTRCPICGLLVEPQNVPLEYKYGRFMKI